MSDFAKKVEENRAALLQCDKALCGHAEHSPMALPGIDEKNTEAAVVNDTIVTLFTGMSAENKKIVKKCVLVASMMADQKYPGGGLAWYNEYISWMGTCGWGAFGHGFSDYTASKKHFTMEQEGLKILGSAITALAVPGPTSALLLKVAADTISVLQASEKPLKLFENSSKRHDGAKFALASAVEFEDGELQLALGAVDFSTSLSVTNVLFWEWNSSSVSIKRGERKLILDHDMYKEVVDLIEKAVAEKARQKILDIKL